MSKLIGGSRQFRCNRIEHGAKCRLLTLRLQVEAKPIYSKRFTTDKTGEHWQEREK